jgi:hypothetical protein
MHQGGPKAYREADFILKFVNFVVIGGIGGKFQCLEARQSAASRPS